MIIKKLRFRNVKSYGNKIQEIEFNNTGELILLSGGNGEGKTSILDSIDIAIFNQARGKESSRIPLKYFPNRMNKNLEVEVDFYNLNQDFIEMNRCIAPNNFQINVNNKSFTENFKLLNDDEKEKLIGFNYQTFKSFISISMDDFLNFINLKIEDKRNLLNRMFNLQDLDDYLSITKELFNQNKKEIQRISNDIISIENELKDYMKIIKDNKVDQKTENLDDIKKQINNVKNQFNDKQKEIKEIKKKLSDFQVNIQKNKNEISSSETENIKRRTELNEIRSKIKIYEDGNCPYCDSELKTHDHEQILSGLREKEEYIVEKITENNNKITYYKESNNILISQVITVEDGIRELEDHLIDIKSNAKTLKNKYENFKTETNNLIKDLKEKGVNLVNDKKEKVKKIKFLKEDNDSLSKLIDILGDNGVRKNIISSLAKIVNENLKKLLKIINFPYIVNLNDDFDAEIFDRGDLTHSEMSSNGEIRMLNICIAISYIQMIRKNKNINILFMDEVFQSVEKDNISILLKLLKDFAKENNINLILVHHGLEDFDPKYFDKIIKVQKDVYSDLKIY